ncbi:uncharacterized protein LOC115628289 [Scaptodrosophila lebanonensis]|uniref:Uncharacterized protein LOC115628289 n=1 Tax=Drosophila lebanonensis TaxID=7225 RepID=A0A6J2TUF4_DROLE|nr:uncharacterized protein LOC115628289 [Scaptodrosophila lebanonensis]
MSLVAYDASTDEESDNEEENSGTTVQLLQINHSTTNKNSTSNHITKPSQLATNGHISDDDDDFEQQEVPLHHLNPGRPTLALPKPRIAPTPDNGLVDFQVTTDFAKLPTPRNISVEKVIIEEADDEFLHKKAVPLAVGSTLEKPPPPPAKSRVKISIPSLKEFSDVDKEKAEKLKNREIKPGKSKGSGLLSILPQAKSERDFTKKNTEEAIKQDTGPSVAANSSSANNPCPAFVPDTVKQRRSAYSTEFVDGTRIPLKKPQTKAATVTNTTTSLVNASDSDDDENSSGDFFSLHSEEKLPEISKNEINALVAKRAAKMVEASNKFFVEAPEREEPDTTSLEELQLVQKRYHEQKLNAEAMDALVGKNAKRRRKEAQEMQVIDISGSEVLPDREEWMRTALASSTSYQPTGVLTDEEPVAGTRRKHQITYLAHKAKANEAELQAMWSANRQTRRATQSKYGF